MALVVASNMAALNTYNILKKNDKKMANNLEKVASGMKINSAKDDASGYAISEKMRVQIRALNQDDQNVKNGKSLLFVAHGGIQEIVNNLRTIKEMALNAANDTNTDEDRAIIQKELEQRKLQIDDIASTTEFNGKYLLNGNLKSKIKNQNDSVDDTYGGYNIPTVEKGKIIPSINPANSQDYSFTITEDGIYGINWTGGAKNYIKNYTIYIDAENVALQKWHSPDYVSLNIVCLRNNTNIFLGDFEIDSNADGSIIKFGSGSKNTLTFMSGGIVDINRELTGNVPESNSPVIDIGGGLKILGKHAFLHDNDNIYASGTRIINAPVVGTKASYHSNANLIINLTEELVIYTGYEDYFSKYNAHPIGSGKNGSMGNISQIGGNVRLEMGFWGWNTTNFPDVYGAGKGGSVGNIIYDHVEHHPTVTGVPFSDIYYPASLDDIEDMSSEHEYKDGLIIHTGTKANENIHINIDDMHCNALGIGNIKVVNRDEAINSLSYIDSAINKALGEITDVGAYMSRMDFTDNNIITAQENITSAESVIRDADMAKEMTDYSKHNVLLQAAQSMLAQANQNSSMVLSLLQ